MAVKLQVRLCYNFSFLTDNFGSVINEKNGGMSMKISNEGIEDGKYLRKEVEEAENEGIWARWRFIKEKIRSYWQKYPYSVFKKAMMMAGSMMSDRQISTPHHLSLSQFLGLALLWVYWDAPVNPIKIIHEIKGVNLYLPRYKECCLRYRHKWILNLPLQSIIKHWKFPKEPLLSLFQLGKRKRKGH